MSNQLSELEYQEKYLKYKSKYLDLIKQKGGAKFNYDDIVFSKSLNRKGTIILINRSFSICSKRFIPESFFKNGNISNRKINSTVSLNLDKYIEEIKNIEEMRQYNGFDEFKITEIKYEDRPSYTVSIGEYDGGKYLGDVFLYEDDLELTTFDNQRPDQQHIEQPLSEQHLLERKRLQQQRFQEISLERQRFEEQPSEQLRSEEQRLKDVELLKSLEVKYQRFYKGSRFQDFNTKKKGIVTRVRENPYDEIQRKSDPSFYAYEVEFEDGTKNTYNLQSMMIPL